MVDMTSGTRSSLAEPQGMCLYLRKRVHMHILECRDLP